MTIGKFHECPFDNIEQLYYRYFLLDAHYTRIENTLLCYNNRSGNIRDANKVKVKTFFYSFSIPDSGESKKPSKCLDRHLTKMSLVQLRNQ